MSRLLDRLFRAPSGAPRLGFVHHSLRPRPENIVRLEPLEPRVLLSGDLAGNSILTARDLGELVRAAQIADSVSPSDTDDFYQFFLTDAADVRINLSGMNGNADLQLIRDANDNGAIDPNEILGASSKPGSSNEFLNRRLSEGNYFVRVLQGVGDSHARYTLSLLNGPNPGDIYETDDSPLFPSTIVSGLGQARSLGTASDVDWVRFRLMTTADVNIQTWHPRLPGMLDGDVQVQLFSRSDFDSFASGDFAHALMAVSDEGQSSPTTRIATRLAAGTYYLRITEPGMDARVPYYMLDYRASGVASPRDPDGAAFLGRDLGLLLGTQTIRDQLGGVSGDQKDFFRFDVTNPIALHLTSQVRSGEVRIDLLDGWKNEITPDLQSDTVSGPIRDRSLYLLDTGTYFVRVSLPEESQLITSSAILRGNVGPAVAPVMPLVDYTVELTSVLQNLLGTSAPPF